MKVLSQCPACGYPIDASHPGDTVCAYCSEPLQIKAITINSTFFWGSVAFIAGVVLGPSIIASFSGGRRWLEEQARRVGS